MKNLKYFKNTSENRFETGVQEIEVENSSQTAQQDFGGGSKTLFKGWLGPVQKLPGFDKVLVVIAQWPFDYGTSLVIMA